MSGRFIKDEQFHVHNRGVNAQGLLVNETPPGRWDAAKWADISEDKQYRYCLSRCWAPGIRALFVMLNPSTADAEKDDPTIRKCIQFAKNHGTCALDVVNLYAYRATDPKVLKVAGYLVGPANDSYIDYYAANASLIVAAWGANAPKERADYVYSILNRHNDVCCLGKTKDGFPKHPLYVPYETMLELF